MNKKVSKNLKRFATLLFEKDLRPSVLNPKEAVLVKPHPYKFLKKIYLTLNVFEKKMFMDACLSNFLHKAKNIIKSQDIEDNNGIKK